MLLSYSDFLLQFTANPTFRVAALLILAVLLVNGWTDAPNAIACAVVTNALPFHRAVLLAAVSNFLGVVCATLLTPAVTYNIYSMAVFSGGPRRTLCALCAALCAIVLWAVFAWLFGIPTSESHALIAGLSGAAVALEGDFSCIRWESWRSVLWGLLLSLGIGFVLGGLAWKLVHRLPLSSRLCRRLQIPGAAVSAFLHGAQDGQKFLGVFLLGCTLAEGSHVTQPFHVPLWLMILCALFMALGTGLGGRRIIDKVGREMVQPGPKEGLASDIASGMCLCLATLFGFPVSTTHTRTAVLLGVGRASCGNCNRQVVRSIVGAWLLTFPGCFLLGYGFARLLLRFL